MGLGIWRRGDSFRPLGVRLGRWPAGHSKKKESNCVNKFEGICDQTTVIAAPVRLWRLLPSVLVSGRSNAMFLEVYSVTPSPHACKAFSAKNRSLIWVWRIGVPLTLVFINWIGPWHTRPQKSCTLIILFTFVFRKLVNTCSKSKL